MNVQAQMASIISGLPNVNSQAPLDQSTIKENLHQLSTLLPSGDSVQFEYGDAESKEYYPLNEKGIRFIDLNFDGHPDLLYSGQSGWNNLTDTKVYLNKNGQLKFFGILNGDVITIDQKSNEYEVFTHWTPCCDSYTSRIEKYIFNKTDSVKLSQSISYIGKAQLTGCPEFDGKKTTVKDLELFASLEDFRGTSPWFRGRNRNARDSLYNDHFISMIKLRGNIPVSILNQMEYNGVTWHLVITKVLSNVPESLYEWSSGNGRRLIGWTNKLNE
ncbi:MAG: hypothetical protein RIF39_04225 [Cyclobacteriaceae bacterium]